MILSKNDTVLILSHYYKRASKAGGPPQEVRDYSLPRVKQVIYIEHPFPYADDHRSSMTIYEHGKRIKTIYTPALRGPQAFYYVLEVVITWIFLTMTRKRYHLCIALDNLNTLAVLPFRWLGIIHHLVFYTIDYTPKRFINRLLNRLYLIADKLACYLTDTIWILSDRMTEERQKQGVDTAKSAPQVILPMGANLERIKRLPVQEINRNQLIFVGHLLEKQGLQLVIEALPNTLKQVPATKLIVIGQGEYEKKLRQLTQSLKLEKVVYFKGFIEKHEEVESLLCKSAIGLAPYAPSKENYTFYTDPGKPKLYLGCGLPVIITDVPAIARVIAKHKAGMIVEYESKSVTAALVALFTNDKRYKEYRANAITLSELYDTNTLISRALEQTNERD